MDFDEMIDFGSKLSLAILGGAVIATFLIGSLWLWKWFFGFLAACA